MGEILLKRRYKKQHRGPERVSGGGLWVVSAEWWYLVEQDSVDLAGLAGSGGNAGWSLAGFDHCALRDDVSADVVRVGVIFDDVGDLGGDRFAADVDVGDVRRECTRLLAVAANADGSETGFADLRLSWEATELVFLSVAEVFESTASALARGASLILHTQ